MLSIVSLVKKNDIKPNNQMKIKSEILVRHAQKEG